MASRHRSHCRSGRVGLAHVVEFWWRMGWSRRGGSGSSREAGRHPGGR